MANYTMTINECLNNPLTPLFNFEYPFYIDDVEAKAKFEEKFILYYWNCEIGFETFARFQKALQSRLTIKMPYYQQLYMTELKSKEINFLLNKDLTESFSREIDTENQLTGTNTVNQNSTGTNSFNQSGSTTSTNSSNQTGSSTSTNSSNQTGSTTSTNSMTQSTTSSSTNSTEQNGTITNTHKESAINDGVAMATLSEGYLTGTSSDSGTSSNESSSSSTGDNESSASSSSKDENETTSSSSSTDENETTSSSSSTDENETSGTSNSTDSVETTGATSQTGNEKMVEKTVLLSQGNIGITSSAELLQKWREVLINIDEIIIEDCRDLFMRIY